MATGLPVSRLINVSVSLAPTGASYANIDSLLILGDSNVIDTVTRIRSYGDLSEVASDFGTSAPEYDAAALFFAQSPTPTQLYIGRWASAATKGALYCAQLTTAQQALSNFTGVTSGAFKVQINGAAAVSVSGLNFSTATSLSNVASIIDAALTGADCVWNGSQFVFTSQKTGTSSAISFLTAPTSGTDITTLLGGLSGAGGYVVPGLAAETPVQAVTILDNMPTYWYGLSFASTVTPTVDQLTAVAAYIQGTKHLFGLTTADANAVSSASTADIGYICEAANYTRTFGQYSTQTPFAETSIFGSLLTTNFDGQNTMPTAMWKSQPGVLAEPLSSTNATTLDTKRYNYFTNFQNGASILVGGRCFGDAYIDEIFGLDWLENRIQTDVFNLMAGSLKIPQTDAGITQIVNVIEGSLNVAVDNGLLAPGKWNAGGFGNLKTGDQMPKGYYIYAPTVASQSAANRAARKSPVIQIAAKLAGSVHEVDVQISVNR